MSDQPTPENQEPKDKKTKTFTEEIELAGNQLVETVQDIVRKGNLRRLIIKTADDRVLLDTTLTMGALAGGALAMVYWPLAAVAAIAGAVARVKVEVVREITDDDLDEGKTRIEIEAEDE